MKKCVLYERECILCNECNICDLNPEKICDSCGKCIASEDGDYREILIDDILFEKNYGEEENEDD